MRLLDARNVRYQVLEIPQKKLSALEVANFLDENPSIIYKSIVTIRNASRKPVLALVAGNTEVDLKKLARGLGEKKMSIPTQDQAENLTGLLAGGISPLAVINKGFQTVIDLPAQNLDGIIISAGERGLQIKIHPDDLAKLVNARFLEIST